MRWAGVHLLGPQCIIDTRKYVLFCFILCLNFIIMAGEVTRYFREKLLKKIVRNDYYFNRLGGGDTLSYMGVNALLACLFQYVRYSAQFCVLFCWDSVKLRRYTFLILLLQSLKKIFSGRGICLLQPSVSVTVCTAVFPSMLLTFQRERFIMARVAPPCQQVLIIYKGIA